MNVGILIWTRLFHLVVLINVASCKLSIFCLIESSMNSFEEFKAYTHLFCELLEIKAVCKLWRSRSRPAVMGRRQAKQNKPGPSIKLSVSFNLHILKRWHIKILDKRFWGTYSPTSISSLIIYTYRIYWWLHQPSGIVTSPSYRAFTIFTKSSSKQP